MQITDLCTLSNVIEVLGYATSGTSFNCPQEPSEVRIFDSEHPNGYITTWTYDSGTLVLDTELTAGQNAYAYGTGDYFLSNEIFIRNNSTQLSKQCIMRISDTYKLEDIALELVELGFSEATVLWYDGEDWQEFPFEQDELDSETNLDIPIKVEINNTDPNSNLRDIFFHLTCRRVSDE